MSQPDALRLADAWDQAISTRRHVSIGCEMADELRRLHAENEALLSAVSEAVAAEREACAEIATDEDNIVDVPGYSAQLGDAMATARKIEKAIRARGAP